MRPPAVNNPINKATADKAVTEVDEQCLWDKPEDSNIAEKVDVHQFIDKSAYAFESGYEKFLELQTNCL